MGLVVYDALCVCCLMFCDCIACLAWCVLWLLDCWCLFVDLRVVRCSVYNSVVVLCFKDLFCGFY